MRRHIVTSGLVALLMGSAPALAEPAVVVLGGGQRSADPVSACGLVASSPWEPARIGAGVAEDGVFIDSAIASCEAALAASPDSTEVQTWLGRVYILVGRQREAVQLLEAAVSKGSGFAAYLLSRLVGEIPDRDTGYSDTARAFDLLRQAADAGFPPALNDLAGSYETGTGVDLDYVTASELYRQASEAGYGLATYKLGLLYHSGLGVDFDYATAMSFYEQAAQQGEPLGHYGVGQLYEYGQGVRADPGEAAESYQLGADRREPASETALAYLYEQGMGVAQDYDKSFALLLDAAGQGYGFGQAALSIHYLFGQGTDIDYAKANDLAWAAQRQGIVYAEGIIAYMFMEGLGVERSLSNALFHFQAGADKGDQYSSAQISVVQAEIACLDEAGSPWQVGNLYQGVEFDVLDAETAISACEYALSLNGASVGDKVWLARAYMKAERYDDAVPLLDEGVSAANTLAQVLMGDLLMAGNGVAADPGQAIALYRSAAAEHFAPALFALGQAYASGQGVEADPDEAVDWFRQAIDQGMEIAQAQIDALAGGNENGAVDMTGFGREGPAY